MLRERFVNNKIDDHTIPNQRFRLVLLESFMVLLANEPDIVINLNMSPHRQERKFEMRFTVKCELLVSSQTPRR